MNEECANLLTDQERGWYKLLQESKKSGMTQKKFCEQSGIDHKEFRKHRLSLYKKLGRFKGARTRRGQKDKGLMRFLPAKLRKTCETLDKQNPLVRLEMGDVRVFVPAGFDSATLKSILKAIR